LGEAMSSTSDPDSPVDVSLPPLICFLISPKSKERQDFVNIISEKSQLTIFQGSRW